MRLFVFRLAGHLGKTVREIEETMDSKELSEWMEYSRVEPVNGCITKTKDDGGGLEALKARAQPAKKV